MELKHGIIFVEDTWYMVIPEIDLSGQGWTLRDGNTS